MKDNKFVNAMRSLALQAIMAAKQGHTGMAMSAAPINYAIYTKDMHIVAEDPKWINRDRFVLSAGHGSMSLYSVLHFAGLISLEEIKKHRQGSTITPGHPEYGPKNFVDATTGPLGQGIANGVGMAIAEKYIENQFPQLPGIINHNTFVVCGDGDLQEGISYESMSIAGKLGLNKLIILHDSNSYQLDSAVSEVNTEDIRKRVLSMKWDYRTTSNDPEQIHAAVLRAKKSMKPSFIEVKTIIGEGTTHQADNSAHGCAVNEKEIANADKYFDMNYDNWNFPKEIYYHFGQKVLNRGRIAYKKWNAKLDEFKATEPEAVKRLLGWFERDFSDFSNILNTDNIAHDKATRDYTKNFFDQLNAAKAKEVITLSADLAGSTKVKIGSDSFNQDNTKSHVNLGIREFAIAGIQNGVMLHGGLFPVASTFLVFADYMKSAIRIGALNNLPSTYIFSHDTYMVGADGPTHQPYDQIPMLRAIANVVIFRPADEVEEKQAFIEAVKSKGETHVIVTCRQPIPSSYNTNAKGTKRGGYIVKNVENADFTIVANGSDLELAHELAKSFKDYKIKVVSVPSLKTFLKQDGEYISKTISSSKGVIAIECSSDYMWYKLGLYNKNGFMHQGAFTFGESKDGLEIYREAGFEVEHLITRIKNELL